MGFFVTLSNMMVTLWIFIVWPEMNQDMYFCDPKYFWPMALGRYTEISSKWSDNKIWGKMIIYGPIPKNSNVISKTSVKRGGGFGEKTGKSDTVSGSGKFIYSTGVFWIFWWLLMGEVRMIPKKMFQCSKLPLQGRRWNRAVGQSLASSQTSTFFFAQGS